MDEDMEKAAGALDALWGAGTADAIKREVDLANAQIKAAAEQVLPPGISTPDRKRISVITTALTADYEYPDVRNEEGEPVPLEANPGMPEVNIGINHAATLENGGRAVFHVYVSGMTEDEVKKAEARLKEHDAIMLGVRLLQGVAQKALRGEV